MIDPNNSNTWPRHIRNEVEGANTVDILTSLAKSEVARLKLALAADNLDASLVSGVTSVLDQEVKDLDVGGGDPPGVIPKGQLALLLEGIERANRACTVAQLDKAAKILVAAFSGISIALVAAGFATGDFTRFYRNDFGWAVAFLFLAGLAILVGTFAFLIDAVESSRKLRVEQAAIYGGVVAYGAAFIIATWGLASGSNGGNDRPTLTTTLTITTSQVGNAQQTTLDISAHASRAGVQQTDALAIAVWGHQSSGYKILRFDIVGPAQDGTADETIDLREPAGAYDQYIASAVVAHAPTPAAAPPENCGGGGEANLTAACSQMIP